MSQDILGRSYVVVHEGVGRLARGDVASGRAILGDSGSGPEAEQLLLRLLRLQAIRPTTDAEAGAEKLALPEPIPTNRSAESKIAERDAEIARLKRELDIRTQEAERLRAAMIDPALKERAPIDAEVLKQKDQTIEQLQKELAEEREAVRLVQIQLSDYEKKLQALAPPADNAVALVTGAAPTASRRK